MVPGFILKLWKLVNDSQCDDLICWSENGQSFIILDPPRFSKELSKYFKHNNISSFIRQLNMYGFRKVATIEGTDDLHFYHPDFIRDQPSKLEAIKRKLPQKLPETVDLGNVYKGIAEIEDKQNDTTKQLIDLKRENAMLWAELHDLRQKHEQQQMYISRLMKLVFEAMEVSGVRQLKRQSPLMIEGSDENAIKRTKTENPETASTSCQLPVASPVANPVIYPIVEPVIDPITNNIAGILTVPVAEPVIADPSSVDPTTTTPTTTTPSTTTPTTTISSPALATPVTSEYVDNYKIVEQIERQGDEIDTLVPTFFDSAELPNEDDTDYWTALINQEEPKNSYDQ